jgi:thymidylate synthase (FAD)
MPDRRTQVAVSKQTVRNQLRRPFLCGVKMTGAVRLIALTKPVIDECITAEDLVAFCARVSNPANQANHDTAGKLLKYLAKNKHWSPFEMVNVVLEITTTRDIARQILRHRSFSFQEFCVTGDTRITLELPNGVAKGKRAAYTRTIEQLYRLQQESPKRLPKCVRVFDENTRAFVTAPIKEVFQTGVKPVFRITMANGKTIDCTKEHKFLTQEGFIPIEDAIGLKVLGTKAVMTNPNTFLACNGVTAHQDRDWLVASKSRSIQAGSGLQGIAKEAGVTTHTIRKWLKHHQVQFTKKEVSSYTPAWNRGVTGYSTGKRSLTTIQKMRASAKKGADSNLWRGGVSRSERLRIADWCTAHRAEFLIKAGYKCQRCRSSLKLELHHMQTVAARPDLAYDKENIEVLCNVCHDKHHALNGDAKKWREKHKGHTLTVEWCKVSKVEFLGDHMTYDLEVQHDSHNYVGNGLVVHNSQRYAAVVDFAEPREARMQDAKNRQNSTPADDALLAGWWEQAQATHITNTEKLYKTALDAGIAKEVARSVLPEGLTTSRLYMSGSLRSWIHYVLLRTGNGTQLEHRHIALRCQGVLVEQFPALSVLFETEHDQADSTH